MSELNAVISRWLRTMGKETLEEPPNLEEWRKFIRRVNGHFNHMEEDRELLTRTLELSTAEMQALHEQLRDQRDNLEGIIVAAAEALHVFEEVALQASESPHETSQHMRIAQAQFTARLNEAFAEADHGGMGTSTATIKGLQRSFHVLADQLTTLVKGTSEAASLRKQLEVAGAVQQMLMPRRNEINLEKLEIASLFRPAAECGGDWWAVHVLGAQRLLVVVGDVTGHGVPSAIITGTAKGACDLARAATGGAIRPKVLTRLLNRVIYEAARQRYMMTCLVMVFDFEHQTLVMSNAGHPAPWLIRQGKLHPLVSKREPPLGAQPTHRYTEGQFELRSEDLLLFFTDGISEYEDPSGAQFGDKRLRNLLLNYSDRTPTEIRSHLVRELESFGGSSPQVDDVTFLACRVR